MWRRSGATPAPALLVTGGAGLIGSRFVTCHLVFLPSDHAIVLDALTYAGNLGNLPRQAAREHRLEFVHGSGPDHVGRGGRSRNRDSCARMNRVPVTSAQPTLPAANAAVGSASGIPPPGGKGASAIRPAAIDNQTRRGDGARTTSFAPFSDASRSRQRPRVRKEPRADPEQCHTRAGNAREDPLEDRSRCRGQRGGAGGRKQRRSDPDPEQEQPRKGPDARRDAGSIEQARGW